MAQVAAIGWKHVRWRQGRAYLQAVWRLILVGIFGI